MTTKIRYTSTDPTITASVIDGDYLWYSTNKDSDNYCHLKKVAATNIDQVYFDLEIDESGTSASIVTLKIYSTNIYVLFSDNTYLVSKYATSSPHSTTVVNFTAPPGVTENPVDMVVTSTNVYVLIAGESGANAQIIKYNLTGKHQATIELDYSGVIVDTASSLAVDDSDNIWVVTNTNPVELVRVWDDAGWRLVSTNIAG